MYMLTVKVVSLSEFEEANFRILLLNLGGQKVVIEVESRRGKGAGSGDQVRCAGEEESRENFLLIRT